MSQPVTTDGQQTPREAIKRLENYTVVDCDVHEIIADLEEFATYVDDPWRGKLQHTIRSDEPLARGITGSFHYNGEPLPDRGLGDEVHATSPEGLHAFMDHFNTDYVILHGNQLEAVPNLPDAEYAAALCSAYNDYLLDNFLDDNEGLKGSIRIAPQAPEAAAEEIHRLASEEHLVSVHIPAAPLGQLGEDEYEPIYQAASEEAIPIDFHVSFPNIPWSGMHGGGHLHSGVEEQTVFHQAMMVHLPSLIFQGIPERYPDIDYVFLEQGVTWIPWLLGRMDKAYERRKHALDHLTKRPSEYVRDHFYFGSQPMEDPAGPAELYKILEMMDAKHNLMYTSDFPHFDFDYPSVLTIPQIDEETERRIFGGNAQDVFGL